MKELVFLIPLVAAIGAYFYLMHRPPSAQETLDRVKDETAKTIKKVASASRQREGKQQRNIDDALREETNLTV